MVHHLKKLVASLIAGLLCLAPAQAQFYPGQGPWLNTANARTGAYAALLSDCGNTLSLGGAASYTLTINAASNYTGQCVFVVVNTDASQTKTLAVNGLTSQTLGTGQTAVIFNNGGTWVEYFALTAPFSPSGIIGINRLTSNFTATSTTTLTNSGISVSLNPGNYHFHALLMCAGGASTGGCQFGMATTATVSSVLMEGFGRLSSTITGYNQSTSFPSTPLTISGTNVSATGEFNGTLVVTGAGAINVQFAQQASNATASTLEAGSVLIVYQTSN